ncbi:MAG TPA: hypothetical protein VHN18_11000 [Micromonosporaceae bacterium]|nr:hypothetical protein [Micromonosporaceae bacterium]
MASHQLIDTYLADLARRLPDSAVDELADGVTDTWQHHLADGLSPTAAAHAAIAEFGTAEQITAAFVAQAPGRRLALALLATGPLVGICWGTSLIAAHAWTWPIPTPAAAAFALGLLAAVASLITAATSRRNYRRTRLGTAGGLGLVLLDVGMLAAALQLAPILAWPMLAAISASIVRAGLTLHTLPKAFAH